MKETMGLGEIGNEKSRTKKKAPIKVPL